jgi:dolichyl-phosphate beta-glucosyltransferase
MFDDTIMVMDNTKNINANVYRSIIIPAYAEEKFIGGTLNQLYEYLKNLDWLNNTEVVIVTAEAPDQTVEIVASEILKFPLNQHVKPGPRVGKGRDVKAGLKVARGRSVIFMDADLATPLNYLEQIFNLLENKGGMVIGVREINTMHKTLMRKMSSLFSNSIIRVMIGWNISDSQCGFKGFDRDVIEIILPRSQINGRGFDVEFIKIAKIHKIKITPIKILDWKDPKPEGEGLSGDSQFAAMKKTFSELLKVKSIQMSKGYK